MTWGVRRRAIVSNSPHRRQKPSLDAVIESDIGASPTRPPGADACAAASLDGRPSSATALSFPAPGSVFSPGPLARPTPGRFDRAVTLPIDIDADKIKAECRDGILALYLPRAERDKPRTIEIS